MNIKDGDVFYRIDNNMTGWSMDKKYKCKLESDGIVSLFDDLNRRWRFIINYDLYKFFTTDLDWKRSRIIKEVLEN